MSNVQLVVYDLSHGMARQLSAQFLGGPQYAIDIIPHTALVVFGREYFFGGGIQHEDPQQFRRQTGMHPIRTLPLGMTSVSRADFEAWCAASTRNGRYTAASYDLLQRNCNNFSHDAAREGLRLSQGVPEWILQVPQKFLSSPMGLIIRPMLENMQVSGNGGGGAAPFANTPTSSFASAPAAASVSATSSGENPWANIVAANGSTSPFAESNSTPSAKGTPTLDSFDKPMISKDSKTISLCVKKLVASLQDAEDRIKLQDIGTALSGNSKVTAAQVDDACGIIHQKLLSNSDDTSATPITFVLMFLRVLILQSTTADSVNKESHATQCLDWVCQQLQAPKDESKVSAAASRAIAYLVLANAASVSGLYEIPSDLIESSLLKDWAVVSQPRPEVRQAAAALAVNYVLEATDKAECGDVSDQLLSLVCASMEGLDAELDSATKLRRMLVASRILRPVKGSTNGTIRSLMIELGYSDNLQQNLVDTKNADLQCLSLAQEIISLLNG